MRATKFMLFSFCLIWSTLSSAAVRAENGSPAKSDKGRAEQEVTSSVKISSETVRSYINWIVQQTGWPAANVPLIKITSFAHLRELSGLSSEAEWIRPAAFYSKGEHVIYLADSWNKDDLVDQSILVHELVHHLILGLPGVVPAAGGVPIIVGGKVIGAIGVSGATPLQDHQSVPKPASRL